MDYVYYILLLIVTLQLARKSIMKFASAFSLALLGLCDAYPSILARLEETASNKAAQPRLNKRVPFDAASQLVSVTGEHEFVAPGSGDQRGPCPGLNALANHGYLPHNGIGTITDFITSTNEGSLIASTIQIHHKH